MPTQVLKVKEQPSFLGLCGACSVGWRGGLVSSVCWDLPWQLGSVPGSAPSTSLPGRPQSLGTPARPDPGPRRGWVCSLLLPGLQGMAAVQPPLASPHTQLAGQGPRDTRPRPSGRASCVPVSRIEAPRTRLTPVPPPTSHPVLRILGLPRPAPGSPRPVTTRAGWAPSPTHPCSVPRRPEAGRGPLPAVSSGRPRPPGTRAGLRQRGSRGSRGSARPGRLRRTRVDTGGLLPRAGGREPAAALGRGCARGDAAVGSLLSSAG